MESKLGKIEKVWLGFGGYQEAEFGAGFTLSGKGFGVNDFWGFWADPPRPEAKWSAADQHGRWAEIMEQLKDLMQRAKVDRLERLQGVPVEIVFDNMKLESWRILEEVL